MEKKKNKITFKVILFVYLFDSWTWGASHVWPPEYALLWCAIYIICTLDMVYIYLLVPYFIFKLLYSGNMSFLK